MNDPIRKWLDDQHLQYAATDDGSVIEVTIPSSGGRTLRMIGLPDADHLLVTMVAEPQVARTRWAALYPLLAEANAALSVGAWVLDPERGTLVFRTSLPTVGASYESATLQARLAYVASTVAAMETAFTAALDDATSPESGDAVEDVMAAWAAEDDA